MIDWNTCPSLEKHPERLSGAWVFRGTRVPLVALFENMEDGVSVNDFVELFPGVQLEQVQDVLEHAAKSVSSAHWFENFVRSRNASSFAKLHNWPPCAHSPSTRLVKFTQWRVVGQGRTRRFWITANHWFKSSLSAKLVQPKNLHHRFKFYKLAAYSAPHSWHQFSDQFVSFQFLSNDQDCLINWGQININF